MRKFLYHIIFFTLILVISNLLLIDLGNHLYYKNYDKHKLNYNSYLFADSHGTPLGAYTQKYNVYNFSAGSDSYIDIKRKIFFLIENTKLDTIYLSADEQMLSPYREALNNNDKSSYYATKIDFETPYEYYKSEIARNIIFFQPKMGTVIRKFIGTKLERLFDENVQNVSGLANEDSWSEIASKIKNDRIKNRTDTQFNYAERSFVLEQALREIIDICKRHNIVIIGVKFPLTQEYYNITKDKVFGVATIFKEENLRIEDYQSDFTLESTLFYNEDHLTSMGGEKFADILFGQAMNLRKY